MNELAIKVNYGSDKPTVSGRELHEKLGIKTAYKDWFPRMCEYGFTEGEDFCSFLSGLKSSPSAKPYSHIRGNQSLYAVLIPSFSCSSLPDTVGLSLP